MSVTNIIVAITILISYLAFSRRDLFDKLKFNPVRVLHYKEYYRLITYGFLHGSWSHLLVNMFVLFSFGRAVEAYFARSFGDMATVYYLLLYFGALLVSNLHALKKHKNDSYYNAIGASGAVAAVIFTSIAYAPWHMLYFFGVIPIPGIVFGVIYLFYSYRQSKSATDNIAHDAHIIGAIFGFVFPFVFSADALSNFIHLLFNF